MLNCTKSFLPWRKQQMCTFVDKAFRKNAIKIHNTESSISLFIDLVNNGTDSAFLSNILQKFYLFNSFIHLPFFPVGNQSCFHHSPLYHFILSITLWVRLSKCDWLKLTQQASTEWVGIQTAVSQILVWHLQSLHHKFQIILENTYRFFLQHYI